MFKKVLIDIDINIFKNDHINTDISYLQGDFFHWYPPKKLKYGKPRLGESTLT